MLTRSRRVKSVTVLIDPLIIKRLIMLPQWLPNCAVLPPAESAKIVQKALTGLHSKMNRKADTVPNTRTKPPQATTIRRNEATVKIRYRNKTLTVRSATRRARYLAEKWGFTQRTLRQSCPGSIISGKYRSPDRRTSAPADFPRYGVQGSCGKLQ